MLCYVETLWTKFSTLVDLQCASLSAQTRCASGRSANNGTCQRSLCGSHATSPVLGMWRGCDGGCSQNQGVEEWCNAASCFQPCVDSAGDPAEPNSRRSGPMVCILMIVIWVLISGMANAILSWGKTYTWKSSLTTGFVVVWGWFFFVITMDLFSIPLVLKRNELVI